MCDDNNCNSQRVAHVDAKCSDMCTFDFPGEYPQHNSYVPGSMNIGPKNGDYVDFRYCLDCGKIQGQFPVTEEHIEETLAEIADGTRKY